MKTLLQRDAEFRKTSGATLLPQKTGVSYLKGHSFVDSSTPAGSGGRKDATVYKNNDDDVGYRSSARRRLGAGGDRRSPSPAQPGSPGSATSNDELSLDQLRKKIREKQVLLDALDFTDENQADEDDVLDRRDRREADDLYSRIRRIQEDIDSHPNAKLGSMDSDAERRALRRQLQQLTDRLPEAASRMRKSERAIAEARLELFRLKDAKAHPGSASSVVGTGPGGQVTESDRIKARSKAMMQARLAALTGKAAPADDGADDSAAASKRLEEENSRIRTEKDNNERMIKDVEDSVDEFRRGIEENLKEDGQTASNEHEKRRWEDGLGVEDEVKDFIFDLQRSSRAASVRRDDRGSGARDGRETSRFSEEKARGSVDPPSRLESPAPRAGTPSSTAGSSYSSYRTAEERAAFIKQQAEQRMNERLAALGLKPKNSAASSETAAQKAERERKEKEERVRKAEEEDAKREAQRQQRLADEGTAPPTAASSPGRPTAKKPPPPPARKGGHADTTEKDSTRKAEEARKAEQEQSLLREQQAQEAKTREIE
jgi:actin cytoskeleton-regulatory complex protein PAN1